MFKLTPDIVKSIATRVLFTKEEVANGVPEDRKDVDGLVNSFSFHPERLKEAKPEIDALLAELPDNFRKDKGGGWSFLNGCEDRHGDLWTGEQRSVEVLVCLGIGVDSASWLGKEMADMMPGGVPYFEVHPTV